MNIRLPRRIAYSRTEVVSDLAIHAFGLTAAIMAVPILITRTWTLGRDAFVTAGVVIYGATLIAMILCSALYNMVQQESTGRVLRRLDHSAIYLKIAGTYTPFALLSPNPSAGFLIWIWTCAAFGAGLRSFAQDRWRVAAIGLYLVMGWSGAAAGGALFAGMPPPVFALILSGGILYTIGFAFYLSPRLPFHRTIWHLFVILASAVFFLAVARYVPGRI